MPTKPETKGAPIEDKGDENKTESASIKAPENVVVNSSGPDPVALKNYTRRALREAPSAKAVDEIIGDLKECTRIARSYRRDFYGDDKPEQ